MPYFLYLSDVFCPWCYGFAPVVQELTASQPAFAVKVLVGNLVPEAETLDRFRQRPNITAFFERLQRDTGQPVAAFVRAMQSGASHVMCSPRIAPLLVALRELAPQHELAQMEFLQQVFYGQGRDLFAADVLQEAAARWQVDAASLSGLCAADDTKRRAVADAALAEEILDEFCIYPTLFLVDDARQRHLLARGFGPLAAARSRLQTALACLNGGQAAAQDGTQDADRTEAVSTGRFCSLDGTCTG